MGRSTVRRGVGVVAALAVATILGGCGGDGGDGGDGGEAAADDDSTSEACATELTASYPDGTEVALHSTAALALQPAAAYTVYAADFEVAADSVSGAVPEEGGNLATVAITTFNSEGTPPPVEEGAVIDWTTDFGVLTFSVVLNQDTTAFGNTAGGTGTLEVLELDDEALCIAVDYADDEKSLRGTIAAHIF